MKNNRQLWKFIANRPLPVRFKKLDWGAGVTPMDRMYFEAHAFNNTSFFGIYEDGSSSHELVNTSGPWAWHHTQPRKK